MQTRINDQPILFQTNPDRCFFAGVRALYILCAVALSLSLFLLAIALIVARGNARALAEAHDPVPTACLMVGLCFLLLSLFFFLQAKASWQRLSHLLSSNFVTVYEDGFRGSCMGAEKEARAVSFALPFSSVTRVSTVRWRVRILFGQEEVSLLCLHTKERVYALFGVQDPQMAANHLSYFLKKDT